MEFTFQFLKFFVIECILATPLLLFLFAAIVLMGVAVGRKQNWPLSDSLYFALITATTVGYGDYLPLDRKSKFLAVAIAMLGLIWTGIVVAIAVSSAGKAFESTHDVERLQSIFNFQA